MKNLLLIALFCSTSLITFAQLEWVSDGNGFLSSYDYEQKFTKLSNGRYALRAGDAFVMNLDGEQLYQHKRDYGAITSTPIELTTWPGGEIVIGDFWYYPGHIGVEFYRFDESWNEIGIDLHWNFHENLSIFSDSSLLYYNDVGMLLMSEQEQKEVSFGIDFIDLIIASSDTVIVLSENEGLFIYDNQLNLVNNIPSINLEKIKRDDNDGYVGIKEDSLYVLNEAYEITHELSFLGDIIRDFTVEEGFLALLMESKAVYTFTYPDLVPFSNFELQEESVFNNISIAGDSLLLSGLERYGGYEANYGIDEAFIKAYSFQGETADFGQDVSATAIDFDVQAELTVHPDSEDSIYKLSFSNLNVTISNEGTKPLHSVTLWARFSSYTIIAENGWPGTYPQYRKKKINHLNLMPGESTQLNWNGLSAWYNELPDSPFNLCIWTARPNGRLDGDTFNDLVCNSQVIVSTEAPILSNVIRLFPNPVGDQLTIKYESDGAINGTDINIINSLGQVIYQSEMIGEQHLIDTDLWSSGLYIVQLSKKGQTLVQRKLVKQ